MSGDSMSSEDIGVGGLGVGGHILLIGMSQNLWEHKRVKICNKGHPVFRNRYILLLFKSFISYPKQSGNHHFLGLSDNKGEVIWNRFYKFDHISSPENRKEVRIFSFSFSFIKSIYPPLRLFCALIFENCTKLL